MADSTNPSTSGDPSAQKELNALLKKAREEMENIKEIETDIAKKKVKEVEIQEDNYDLSRRTSAELRKQQGIYDRQTDLVRALGRELEKNEQVRKVAVDAYKDARDKSREADIKAEVARKKLREAEDDQTQKLQALEQARGREHKKIQGTDLGKELADVQRQKAELASRKITSGKDYNELLEREKTLQERINGLVEAGVAVEKQNADAANATVEAKQKDIAASKEAYKLKKQAGKDLGDATRELISIRKKLEEEKKELEIQKAITRYLQQQVNAQNEIDNFLGEHIPQYKNIKTLVMDLVDNGLNPMKLSLAGSLALLKMSFAAVKIGFDRFKELDDAAGEFRKETGFTTEQMGNVAKNARQINLELADLGVGIKEAYEASAALGKEFNVIGLVTTKDSAKNISMMAANLGISVTDAAKFKGLFESIANSSGYTSEDLIAASSKLASMAGVAPALVLKDMANASQETLTFLSKSPAALIRTTIEARRLGTTVDSLSKSARGFLNYQESITSELEASALIGKALNFQQARAAAYAKDVQKSRELALKEIEKVGDFTALNVYQQEALAKAAQMTVDEVIKQQNQQKMLAALRNSQSEDDRQIFADYQKMQQEMRDNEKAALKNLVEQGREYVKNQNRQAKLNELANAFKGIWTSISDALSPIATEGLDTLITVVKAINDAFKDMSETMKEVIRGTVVAFGIFAVAKVAMFAKSLLSIPGHIKDIATAAKGATSATGGLADAAGKLSDAAGKAGSGAPSTGGRIGRFFEGLSKIKWSDVGKMAAMMVILAGSIYLLGKAFQQFKEVKLEDVGVGLVAFVGSLGIFVAAIKTLGNSIPVAGTLKVGLVIGILSAAALAAGMGFQAFATGVQLLKDANLMELSKGVAALAGAFSLFAVGGVLGAVGTLLSSGLFIGISSLAADADRIKTVATSLEKIKQSYNSLKADLSEKIKISISAAEIKSLEQVLSQKIQAAVELMATVSIEVKNLNELKETINKLTEAITTLGGAAGTATPVVNVNNSSAAIVEKLEELTGLLKSGGIAVYLDGVLVNKELSRK